MRQQTASGISCSRQTVSVSSPIIATWCTSLILKTPTWNSKKKPRTVITLGSKTEFLPLRYRTYTVRGQHLGWYSVSVGPEHKNMTRCEHNKNCQNWCLHGVEHTKLPKSSMIGFRSWSSRDRNKLWSPFNLSSVLLRWESEFHNLCEGTNATQWMGASWRGHTRVPKAWNAFHLNVKCLRIEEPAWGPYELIACNTKELLNKYLRKLRLNAAWKTKVQNLLEL